MFAILNQPIVVHIGLPGGGGGGGGDGLSTFQLITHCLPNSELLNFLFLGEVGNDIKCL